MSEESGDPSVGWQKEPLFTLFVYRSEEPQRQKRDGKLPESDIKQLQTDKNLPKRCNSTTKRHKTTKEMQMETQNYNRLQETEHDQNDTLYNYEETQINCEGTQINYKRHKSTKETQINCTDTNQTKRH